MTSSNAGRMAADTAFSVRGADTGLPFNAGDQ
jgi:hypothetical protein